MKDLLLDIKKYLEENEEAIDGEWGSGRNFATILADGKLDCCDLYQRVFDAIERLA